MLHVQTHLSEARSLALGSEQSRALWPPIKVWKFREKFRTHYCWYFFFLLHLKQNSGIQVRNVLLPKTFPGAKGHFSLGYCCDSSTLV